MFTETPLQKLQNLEEPVRFGWFNNQISSQGSFEDECCRLSNKRSRAIHSLESSTEGEEIKEAPWDGTQTISSHLCNLVEQDIRQCGIRNSTAVHPFERCQAKDTIYIVINLVGVLVCLTVMVKTRT